MNKINIIFLVVLVLASGCSTIYSLDKIIKRSDDEKNYRTDFRVDTASRDVNKISKLAWVGFSVVFQNNAAAASLKNKQNQFIEQMLQSSFESIDGKLQGALTNISWLSYNDTIKNQAFQDFQVKNESYQTSVSRWLEKLGMGSTKKLIYPVAGLKSLYPNEIGWSSEHELAKLANLLGVDGVLVGSLVVDYDVKHDRFLIHGPKVWMFAAQLSKAVLFAELKPSWELLLSDNILYRRAMVEELAEKFSKKIALGLTQ